MNDRATAAPAAADDRATAASAAADDRATAAPGPALEDVGDEELAEERDFLLRSLADLDDERAAGDIDEHDYTALRDGYTARAAAVLRMLDSRRVAAEGPAVEAAPVERDRQRRGRWKVPVFALLAAFGVAAGLLLAHNAGTRLPGDNITGSTPTSPEAKLIAQAQQLVEKGDVLNAVKTYDQVLKQDPRSAEALAEEGWLLRDAGHESGDAQLVDKGLRSILAAEAVDPGYAQAYFFAGETYLADKSDPRSAITQFQQFLASKPPQSIATFVQGELQTAQRSLGPAGR